MCSIIHVRQHEMRCLVDVCVLYLRFIKGVSNATHTMADSSHNKEAHLCLQAMVPPVGTAVEMLF